jgi:hypothetical protein
MRAASALLVAAVVLAACRGPAPEAPPAACTRLRAERLVDGALLCEDAWTCGRPPGGPFDRVGLHRLAACDGADGPVLLYLPGMHMNGEVPAVDARQDLRLYLAARGVRTWGFDYRTHAVPPEATPEQLETLARWTSDVLRDDATWAAGFVRAADGRLDYLAGFSHGAALAYDLASRGVPLGGLVILDGALPTGRETPRGGPAIDVAGGRLPFATRRALLEAVIADPGGPSPLAGFASAGAALRSVLYSAPSFGGRGGLANTHDGVSEPRALALLLRGYDRWWPRAALGGPAPPPPPRRIPVLAFATGRLGPAWVARVRAAATAFGGADATIVELPAYGHLDVLVARNAARDVFQPVHEWVSEHAAPAAASSSDAG